ncbi:MAG: hypothetical protein JKY08_07980 [Flavobacteriaceae bacterium]|nr:hypothetical protein [Flavobacteriaceae bacterium]
MKKKIVIIIIGIIVIGIYYFGFLNYTFSKSTKTNFVYYSPYKVLFNHLKINELTDTILVQNRTKIFGCGTAYHMYKKELNKSGLHKFHEKYGTVLPNLELTNLFEKNHNVKILWINTGLEGELFQLEDTILHNNKELEKRLIAEKTFICFDDTPKSLDSVTVTLLVNYKNLKKTILKSFDLSKNRSEWVIDKEYEKEIKDKQLNN